MRIVIGIPAAKARKIAACLLSSSALCLACAAALLGLPFEAKAQDEAPELPQTAISASPSPAAHIGQRESVTPDLYTGSLGATVHLPLSLGDRGLLPPLALQYNSRNGNGWIGVGWELSIPSIARSTRSGVDYGSDAYVYRFSGGQIDLVKIRDNEFRAKFEGLFLRFARKLDAQGKPLWQMTNGRGTVFEFGAHASATTHDPANQDRIFSWHLEVIRDVHSRQVDIGYQRLGGLVYPENIAYGSPGMRRVIRFQTEGRADDDSSWRLGFATTLSARLKQVDLELNGTVQGSVLLAYEVNPVAENGVGRSRLLALTRTAPNSMAVTLARLAYSKSAGGLAESAVWPGPQLEEYGLNSDCMVGDFSGDGRKDFACHAGAGAWNVTVASKDSWTIASWPAGPAPSTMVARHCLAADFDGNARTDIACYTGSGDHWKVHLSNGTGWHPAQIWAHGPGPITDTSRCTVGDFTADGRADILCQDQVDLFLNPAKPSKWTLSAAVGGSFSRSNVLETGPDWPLITNFRGLGESCITGDYDGDLRSDLACHQGNGKWQLALAKPGKWQTFLEISGPVAPETVSDRCIAADLNRDTLSDIICAQTASGAWQVGIATAGPTFDSSLWTSGPVLDGKLSERCLAGDIDGDGRSDVSCVSSSGSEWITGLSTGKSWSAAKWNSPAPFPLPLHRHCVMGDLRGTGQAGLACKIGGTSWLAGRSADEFGDLLTHITGLYGGETVVKFASSAASFDPRLPALHVVESMENRDGMGGQESTRFEYRHGRYNPVAADFRGFGEVVVTRASSPEVNGIKITHRFLQGDQSKWGPDAADDPIGIYRGRTVQRETAEASGKILARSEFDYHGDLSPPYFTPTSEVREFTCHGTCLPPNRSTLAYDSFGNRTEEKMFLGGKPDTPATVSTSLYLHDEASWILGKIASLVTRSGYTGKVLRETYFYYDATTPCDGELGKNDAITQGNLTGIRRRLNDNQWQDSVFRYDSYGNLACTRNSRRAKSQFEYDATGDFLLAASNDKDQRVAYRYIGVGGQPMQVGRFGLLASVVDVNNRETTYDYDDLGRLTLETRPERATVTHTYSALGTPGMQTLEVQRGSDQSITTYLDGFGRQVRARQTWADGTQIEDSTRFGPMGRSILRTVPRFAGQNEFSLSALRYDGLGRLIGEDSADGAKTTCCYFASHRVTVDGNGHAQIELLNDLGKSAAVLALSGTAARNCDDASYASIAAIEASHRIHARTSYTYDELGRVIGIQDALGNVTETQFDVGGRLVFYKDANRGSVLFEYDTEGNLKKRTDARQRSTLFHYDSLNRIERIEPPQADNDAPITYQYDSGDPADNAVGRLTKSVTQHATKLFSYDGSGAVVQQTTKVGNATYKVRHEFDALGRLSRLIYPDESKVDYEFSGPFLRSVGLDGKELVRYERQTPIGYPQQMRFANGSESSYTFSESINPNCPRPTLRLCSLKILAEGKLHRDYRFNYDGAGNLLELRDNLRSVVQHYFLDDLDRLIATGEQVVPAATWPSISYTSADVSNAPGNGGVAPWLPVQPGVRWLNAYAYDQIGNMVWSSDAGKFSYPEPGPYSVRPHAAERVGTRVHTYDDAGSLSGDGTHSYEVDSDGRTRIFRNGAGETRLGYAADGSLATLERPDGNNRVAIDRIYTCESSGCWKTIFVGEQPIAVAKGAQRFFLHANHLGSIELITDSAGLVRGHFRYGPYGEIVETSVTLPAMPVHTYLGREALLSPSLMQLGMRQYDTRTKRFLSTDPLVGNGTPATASPYSYAYSNPQTFSDSDGQLAWFVPIIVGAVIGGIQAERHGGDFWEGALRGAVAGAFVSLGGYLAAQPGVTAAGQYFVQGWAGALSGAAQYELWGGDGQKMMIGGFISGAVGNYLAGENGAGLEIFGSQNGFTGTLDYLTNAGLRQGFWSASYALATGQDIGNSFREGFGSGVRSGIFYSAVGHGLGMLTSRSLGQWDSANRIYTYNAHSSLRITGITFGNAATSSYPGADVWVHEGSHAPQLFELGEKYAPAHAAALSLSVILTPNSTQGLINRAHERNPLELMRGANEPYGAR